MRISKKILAIALSILMAVSMMPFTVFAATTYSVSTQEELIEALNNVVDGDTVELTADITLAGQTISGESAKYGAYITKSITFDGNNYTITSTDGTRPIGVKGVSGDVSVTFKDLTVSANSNKANAICIITRGGIDTLTLDNVKLDTPGSGKAYNQPLTIGGTQYTQANVNIINGSVIQTNDDAGKYYAILLWNPVNLNIQDSTIKGWACVYQKEFEDGTVDATEVTINNSTLVSVGISGATNHFAAIMTEEDDFSCVITNSNIDVTAGANTYQGIAASDGSSDGFSVEVGEGNDVTMTGDTAIVGFNFEEDDHEVVVTGGTFNTEIPEYYCADGFTAVSDGNGNYTVDPIGDNVAKVNGVLYATLAQALAAAQDGDTIVILNNATIDSTYTIDDGRDITIDLNGKTISSTVRMFNVRHGGLEFTGTGTVSTTAANTAVAVYASTNAADADYSTFKLGENVTLDTPNGYGAMIGENSGKAYGAVLDIDGTINSKWGVYINGNVAEPTDKTNAAKINISGTVIAANTEAAIYAAGYADWTIEDGATIEGGSAIYIKSGNMTIGNATITATGAKTDYTFENNGCGATGDAIVVDSCGYPGNVPTVTVNAGTVTSAYGAAVASYAKQDDPRYPDATYPVVDEIIPATSTAVFSSDVTDLAADGYETVYDDVKGGYVVEEDTHTVAKIGDAKYDTLAAAFAAAQDGDTITLVADATGDGISVPKNQFATGITVDFNGHKYTCNGNYAGSAGTQRQVFQLNEGNIITFKDGTIESEGARMLIQNYSDLTLDNMTLNQLGHTDFSDKIPYAMSNNNGNVTINDTTINACDDGFAFDACRYATYTAVNVTVTGNSEINGNVEMSASSNDAKNGLSITLEGGTLNGDIILDASAEAAIKSKPEVAKVTKADTFTQEAPAGYVWESNGDGTSSIVENTADGQSITVEDKIHLNMYINVAAHLESGDAIEDATVVISYSDPSNQSGDTKTAEYSYADFVLAGASAGQYANDYKFTYLAAPAQIADEVTATIYCNDSYRDTVTTSIKDYCDAVKTSSNTKLANLAKAILDYGKAANDVFSYCSKSSFDGYYNTADVTSALNAAAKKECSNTSVFLGYSYIATAVPALRIYVDTATAESEEWARINGTEVKPKSEVDLEGNPTGYSCIDITGILAENLDAEYTVTLGEATLKINALQYAAAINGANDNATNFARSIYNYNKAAEAYFG